MLENGINFHGANECMGILMLPSEISMQIEQNSVWTPELSHQPLSINSNTKITVVELIRIKFVFSIKLPQRLRSFSLSSSIVASLALQLLFLSPLSQLLLAQGAGRREELHRASWLCSYAIGQRYPVQHKRWVVGGQNAVFGQQSDELSRVAQKTLSECCCQNFRLEIHLRFGDC